MRNVLGLCVIGLLVLTYRFVMSEAGWFLGLCLMGFSLIALLTCYCAIEGLWTTWRRRAFLRSAVGQVIKVEIHSLNMSDSSSNDDVYTPVVRFKTDSGEVKTFTSALSVGSSSKYKVGMTIPVLYDPGDVMPPMIDSWGTIWGGNIFVLIGGLVFVGAAAFFVYAVFVLHVLRGRV